MPPLKIVPRPRSRQPEARPHNEVPQGRGLVGVGGDVRFAWRQWRRSPSFAAVAILTLGLGAGAATAIFSIVDTVLLRPLPFHEPRAAGHDLGEQRREGAAEREAVAGQFHGLPQHAVGVLGGGGLVAPGGQPRRAGPRAGPRQHDRDQRQPVSAAGRVDAARSRISRRRPLELSRPDRRDQRPPVAAALQRRSRHRRQNDRRQQRQLHHCRCDAAEVQFPRRRGPVAAIELGPDAP